MYTITYIFRENVQNCLQHTFSEKMYTIAYIFRANVPNCLQLQRQVVEPNFQVEALKMLFFFKLSNSQDRNDVNMETILKTPQQQLKHIKAQEMSEKKNINLKINILKHKKLKRF